MQNQGGFGRGCICTGYGMMGRGSQRGGVYMFYIGGARLGTEKSGVCRAWSVGEESK